MSPVEQAAAIFVKLGVDASEGDLVSRSPIDGQEIGQVEVGDPDAACARAPEAFLKWRVVPAPRRGELVRLLGQELREAKSILAELITLECGKILQESLG